VIRSLGRIIAVVRKEAVQLRRDRLTFGMVFGIPVMQLLLFGYAINQDVRHLRAGVADLAGTERSRTFTQDAQASQVIDLVATATSAGGLEDMLRRGEIVVGILIPADFEEAIERLEAHGLRMARLDRDSELEVETFRVDSTRVAEREYQGHRLRETWGAWEAGTELILAGDVIVPVGQPLGRLLVLLLEPRSDDGLAAWNFFEAGPDGPLDYPVRRLGKLPDTFDAES